LHFLHSGFKARKITVWFRIFTFSLSWFFYGAASAQSTGNPMVFWSSDQVRPGDAVMLYGGNLDLPDLELRPLSVQEAP
jgi:hypothetical protein